MDLNLNNVTFIIVTYNSEEVINNCLDSIPREVPKIVIENSKNIETKKYLENKYGSVAIAKTTIHHYEYVWSERVEATGTSDPIPEQFLEVDYDSYLATNPDLRRTIYAYEYEDKLNEGHREIQLIQPAFATKVLTESRKIFR